MPQMEELEDVLLSDKVAALDMATWAKWLREYFELRDSKMTKTGLSAEELEYNRSYYEVVTALAELRRPAAGQNIGELSADDLDAFTQAKAKEAHKLAEALENGLILGSAEREKAQNKLSEITQVLSEAHKVQKKRQRQRI